MNLFINSSSKVLSIVTFTDNKEIITIKTHLGNNDHSISLYNIIADMKLDIKQLKKIYLVTGPGSYTGLRVGIIFAKTLAMELNIKIYPINTLHALYAIYQAPVALDARGKRSYIYRGEAIELIDNTELSSEFIIDQELDFSCFLQTNEFTQLRGCDYLDVQLDYHKKALQ